MSPRDAEGLSRDGMMVGGGAAHHIMASRGARLESFFHHFNGTKYYSPLFPFIPPYSPLFPPIPPRGAREGGRKYEALIIFRCVCQVAPAPTPTNVALARG